MQIGAYDVHAPQILGGDRSEAEVLGAAVWLWMHSPQHRDLPLHALPTVLLPIIKHQYYMLVSRGTQPLFFLSWMWLNVEAEQRYLTQPAILVQEDDWASGDRLWLRDWIAPFGDVRAMRRLVGAALFPEQCFRALYHRGAETGQRVINFKGDQVSHSQARVWRAANPLSVSLPEYPHADERRG
ncbi:cytolysin-activating lysine-acyltransferase [Serratia fonticola]|uniref:RTX toxin-activating lysine-acyltransferase n=1 Tax=Serratia fonticola TaxID=47917 RepID=A0A542BS29_SERFO|nr:toxin-activating lysine-acyltransferase [Serratia fonticola]TQI81355.1 cytolysin-activating lysine-acyltransferase [Serratia fonticola]TQI96621.1 cytolysin-activating lysine-acyltransferase [Serratia fonticola]TVZ71118.1 cytolysin-activating lysine-acyltransferase [Serratia fonticola]